MWDSGGNTRLLRKWLRVRFPHSANNCVHEHVSCVVGLGVTMHNMSVFKKKLYQYILIRYLESITQAL
jgi:hypothetical protein